MLGSFALFRRVHAKAPAEERLMQRLAVDDKVQRGFVDAVARPARGLADETIPKVALSKRR